jgi:processive 1,2-diacylglycerol beta-glucosyltransferase
MAEKLPPTCYCARQISHHGGPAIRLYNDQTGEFLGDVSEEDVEFLVEQLEEEFEQDRAYYVNRETVTLLREGGASQELLTAIERGLGPSGEADVTWSES